MNLYANQWHVRLYFWFLDLWDAFLETNSDREQTNLCQYIRMLFIWGPGIILTQLGLVAFGVYVLIWYPVTRFGWGWYGWGIGAIAVIVGLVFAWSVVRDAVQERRYRARYAPKPHTPRPRREPEPEVEAKEERGPGLVAIIFAWMVAQKQKICPLISIVSPNQPVKEGGV
jgi:hypothetical protein